jgi:hypothetical protein
MTNQKAQSTKEESIAIYHPNGDFIAGAEQTEYGWEITTYRKWVVSTKELALKALESEAIDNRVRFDINVYK